MHHPLRTLLIVTLVLVSWPAAAQENGSPEPESHVGDPHDGNASWLQPPPAIQVESDPKLRPAATGGIFVPAMTKPLREPKYFVFQDGKLVKMEQPGNVVYVSPGSYTVLVGSGVPEQQLEFETVVVEGRVTFVPVEWAGLAVTVVDERGSPFRGSYEIVELPDREYVGLGLGAEISEGEELETWLLWPGHYMILAAGESYQARKNFTTLRLEPGELVQYTIVLDRETGDLLGAGEVTLAPEPSEGLDVNVVVGGSVLFNQADNVVGKAEGQSLDLLAFVETIGALLTESHLVYGRLNLEAGGRIKLPDRPFITDVDELHLDLLYAYRVTEWFGPYVRLSAETNMFPTFQEFDDNTSIVRRTIDGDFVESEFDVLEAKLAEPFAPLELEAGTGGRLDFSSGFWLKANTRAGVGFRQVFNRDTYIQNDQTDTPEQLDFYQVDDVTQFGAEGAVVLELNPVRWLAFKADAEILAPFDDFGNPVIDFRGTVTVRLGSVASLNYTLRAIQDPSVTDDTQVDQSLLLRFAYKLL